MPLWYISGPECLHGPRHRTSQATSLPPCLHVGVRGRKGRLQTLLSHPTHPSLQVLDVRSHVQNMISLPNFVSTLAQLLTMKAESGSTSDPALRTRDLALGVAAVASARRLQRHETFCLDRPILYVSLVSLHQQ